MRNKYKLLLKVLLVGWLFGVFVIIIRQPSQATSNSFRKRNVFNQDVHLQIDKLEAEISEQSSFYSVLLDKLRNLQKHKREVQQIITNRDELLRNYSKLSAKNIQNFDLAEGPILPILLLACNRETAIKRSVDLLLKYRPSQERFPIIVSQDCGHQPTKKVIQEYEDQVALIEQPDQSIIEVPLKERKFRGYFMIARHYKWALDQIFHKFNYDAVIIVEDDLDVAPDFYEYFSATYHLLRSDPTLWCVSAWNDNGKNGLIDSKDGDSILYRTDFFPGLGWMTTKDIWGEIGPKWPRSYWDDWIRAPEQRQDRACIRPEIPRTRTFGKKGVSNGLFFDKHLKYIHLNTEYVHFSKMDLTGLLKASYDEKFDKAVQHSQVVTLAEVKSGRLSPGVDYRLIYHTKDIFKKITKALGLMDDFKAGIPRTGYKGIVTLFYGNRRVFIAPNNNWKGYDPTWS